MRTREEDLMGKMWLTSTLLVTSEPVLLLCRPRGVGPAAHSSSTGFLVVDIDAPPPTVWRVPAAWAPPSPLVIPFLQKPWLRREENSAPEVSTLKAGPDDDTPLT